MINECKLGSFGKRRKNVKRLQLNCLPYCCEYDFISWPSLEEVKNYYY